MVAALAALLSASAALAASSNLPFLPDVTFDGASLDGWHSWGQSDWRAENGEFIGTPKQGAGGWLMLDRSFQDIGFHALFQCSGDCKTGVLLRAEKTPTGMTGVLVSLNEGDLACYRVVLDSQGQEVERQPLRSIGGIVRFAPPLDPNAPVRNRSRRGRSGPSVTLPIEPESRDLRLGEWNQIDIVFDANIVRPTINAGGRLQNGVAGEDGSGFGPLALYVGGTGEVRFREVGYKDLSMRVTPKETVSSHFRMQRISDMYYSWAAAAADFDRDGTMDIAAGPYIFYGPDYTRSREIFISQALSPAKDFTRVNGQYAFDFTGDGWPDILTSPPWAMLYVNPKGEARRWDSYKVIPTVQSEVTTMMDLDGDGVPELIYGSGRSLRYAKPDPTDPTKPWIEHAVSEEGYATAHGIGAGDINGDGRPDILNPYGWWEQPPSGMAEQPWTYHPQAFSRSGLGAVGGAGMEVYDANGDGLNDVVTSLNAHGFGLAWYEQKRDAAGKISFVAHIFSDDYAADNAGGVAFSEPHGSTSADLDGDGVPDFIVGKRFYSHLDSYLDPDPYGPPVLYWYRTVRNPSAPGGAEFVPDLIHNRSGVGSDLLATDLNRDGAVDVITSTDRGTFIFWGKPRGNPSGD